METSQSELAQVKTLWSLGRRADALALLNRLAARDDPLALVTLAELSWTGQGVPQHLGRARELFRRAGAAGLFGAASYYTNLLASGIAGPRDWALAMARLGEEASTDPHRREVLDLVCRMALTSEGDPATPPEGEQLCRSPEMHLYRELFSSEECDHLLAVAESGYQPSIVNDATGRPVRDPIRTSDGSAIHWLIEDPAIHALNRRLAAAGGTAYEQGEPMQVLRYRQGQEYKPHFDFARTSENSRVTTALAYLNDDYEGGETWFLKAQIKVRGRKGDVLVFRSMGPDGRVDPMSEHAGLPVTSGVKYLASRWIREGRWTP